MMFFSASTPSKLSFHVITPVIVDCHMTSGYHIAFDLAVNIRRYCIDCLSARIAEIDLTRLALLIPHGHGKGSYALDLASYSTIQLFRMLANTDGEVLRPPCDQSCLEGSPRPTTGANRYSTPVRVSSTLAQPFRRPQVLRPVA